jgi:hypothetical protein
MEAYGFTEGDNLLAKLLELNQQLAEKEKRGDSIICPYAPPG